MIAAALLVVWQTVAPSAGAQRGVLDTARAQPVQMGTSVQPDTVTVGQHFVVRVRVRAPNGSEIGFPTGPDSGTAVEAVDPKRELGSRDTTAVERTAIYRLVAWSVGPQHVTLGSLVVSAGGTDRRYAIPDLPVLVRSVRPSDSTGRVPRPARGVIVAPPVLWPWIAGGLLLLALLEAGERGRYVALHIDVLREYLVARIPGAALSLTSTELLEVLRADAPVPLARLVPVLASADLIKYAGWPVTEARARELASETRGIVEATEEAVLHRAESANNPERAA
jgi:hypothetical protein